MGVFSRMSDIVNSNLNAMLDKAEDPEKMVRLIVQEMEDTLVEVRSAAARAIADRKELERRMTHAAREAAEWQRRAELAITKGRDDLAKAALAEKKRTEGAQSSLQEQHQEVELGLVKLNDDIAALQAKLSDAKHRQKLLETRHDTAVPASIRSRSRAAASTASASMTRWAGLTTTNASWRTWKARWKPMTWANSTTSTANLPTWKRTNTSRRNWPH